MVTSTPKKKLLIFIVAYHASTTIQSVLKRIPFAISDEYSTEVLVIDDQSKDNTFEMAIFERDKNNFPFPIHVLYNPVNQGYGGNQKIGFHYAIKNSFDFVALVHGDGQYAPELLSELLQPLKDSLADAVFGSRMLNSKGALLGGMPMYKFIGNKILTFIQNKLLTSNLSEFHSGYRIYSVGALRSIPFNLNTNDFHFDTQIIIQLMLANLRIVEIPIPTYYGDEICRVNGIKYACEVIITTLKAVIQRFGILYDRKFDCISKKQTNSHYSLKLDYLSPHSLAISAIPSGSKVMDIGCAGGYVGSELIKKGCIVHGIDLYPLADGVRLSKFQKIDLNYDALPDATGFDYFILLDVIEHTISPEAFIDKINQALKKSKNAKLIISTGNIAFFVQRLMLLFGQFNYGERGILDKTHTRLFTFKSLKNLLDESGFDIIETKGIPAPFPIVVKNKILSKSLLLINNILINLSKNIFSYQIYIEANPRPTLESLLVSAEEAALVKLNKIKQKIT
jgi:glycosyltransferase involved in cell wall biosynthesis